MSSTTAFALGLPSGSKLKEFSYIWKIPYKAIAWCALYFVEWLGSCLLEIIFSSSLRQLLGLDMVWILEIRIEEDMKNHTEGPDVGSFQVFY